MGIVIAYLLGILTIMRSKHQNGADSNNLVEGTPRHPVRDSPISYVCIPPTPSEEERSKQNKKDKREHKLFVLQFANVVVLLVYAGFTILIWFSMKKANGFAQQQVETAREQIQWSERPWVAGNHWELPLQRVTKKVGCGDNPCFGVYVVNSGNSPALNVTGGALISIDAPPTGEPPRHMVRGVLANNDIKEPVWFEEPVTTEQEKAKQLYIQSRIEYCDTWNNLHQTNFCLYREHDWPRDEFWPCKDGGDNSIRDTVNGCVNFRKK